MKLYQEELMDHYRNPRNRGRLEAPDFSSDEHNPSCGDSIFMQGTIAQDSVIAIAFEGKGCVISQATASMLSASVKNKNLQDILAIDAAYIISLLGIELGPMRIKCALLSLIALQQGIKKYLDNQETSHA